MSVPSAHGSIVQPGRDAGMNVIGAVWTYFRSMPSGDERLHGFAPGANPVTQGGENPMGVATSSGYHIVMNLILLMVVLLLLFGGGGFYFGGPAIGGGGLGLILLICLIIFLMGGFRTKS